MNNMKVNCCIQRGNELELLLPWLEFTSYDSLHYTQACIPEYNHFVTYKCTQLSFCKACAFTWLHFKYINSTSRLIMSLPNLSKILSLLLLRTTFTIGAFQVAQETCKNTPAGYNITQTQNIHILEAASLRRGVADDSSIRRQFLDLQQECIQQGAHTLTMGHE